MRQETNQEGAMTQFSIGVIVGIVLSGSAVLAAGLYDRHGNPSGPRGSIQQFDYFWQRQQQLDIGHMRRQADQDRLDRMTNPCGK